MLQFDRLLRLCLAVTGVIKGAVVKDVTVLIYLHEGRSAMFGSALQHSTEVLDVSIDRTGNKCRLTANRDRQWVQGIVNGTHW